MTPRRKRKTPANVQAALAELKQGLGELYGERLRGVYLYGSYARGDFHEDSDIDVLVALDEADRPGHEIFRIYEAVAADICLRRDLLISILPTSSETLESARDPFFDNVRQEALAL